jgi:hypothetical protein
VVLSPLHLHFLSFLFCEIIFKRYLQKPILYLYQNFKISFIHKKFSTLKMNRNSIKDLKNIFSAKEQLTIGQQLNIRGGDGEDDEDKRRDGAKCMPVGTPPPPPPPVKTTMSTQIP